MEFEGKENLLNKASSKYKCFRYKSSIDSIFRKVYNTNERNKNKYTSVSMKIYSVLIESFKVFVLNSVNATKSQNESKKVLVDVNK